MSWTEAVNVDTSAVPMAYEVSVLYVGMTGCWTQSAGFAMSVMRCGTMMRRLCRSVLQFRHQCWL
jgi:hypothetical protein